MMPIVLITKGRTAARFLTIRVQQPQSPREFVAALTRVNSVFHGCARVASCTRPFHMPPCPRQ
jgi:hypothetical protein